MGRQMERQTGEQIGQQMEAQPDRGAGWLWLRGQVSRQARLLSAPQPASTAPDEAADAAEECATCRGPARHGSRRCYQCGLHQEYLPGLLPDVVAAVAYAAKGSPHATNLWLYKSGRPGAASAQAALRALLLVFLRDHGRCVWQRAQMASPTHVAVVPSRRARPGAHPLQALAIPYLSLPWARLRLARADNAQYPDPWRFESERITGASVLLLDDTWTSGASAVSAAAAFKLAGARRVAVVVLGRHLDAGTTGGGRFAPAVMPFRPWLCGVHRLSRGQ
jgi:hypothetical protein